jgi:hypothetical protein
MPNRTYSKQGPRMRELALHDSHKTPHNRGDRGRA